MSHKDEIIALLREGRLAQRAIAKKFGVDPGYISRLRKEHVERYRGYISITDASDIIWIKAQMQLHNLDFNQLIKSIVTDARLEDDNNGT